MFPDTQKYVYSESVFSTLYIQIKTQLLKKFSSDVTKNVLFFISRAPTHHSFILTLRSLYELNHKVRLTRIFHFRFRFVVIKVYILVQENAWSL